MIIACDISGTLLDSNGKLNSELFEIIRILSDNNIDLVLCSGGARIRALELANYIGANKYVISSNGADVYDIREKNVIYDNPISSDIIEKLYFYADKYIFRIAFNSDNNIYTNKLIYNADYEVLFNTVNREFINSNKIVQVIVSGRNRDDFVLFLEDINNIQDILVAIKNISSKERDVNDIKMSYSDIVRYDTSKGVALNKLSEYLNIDKKDIIAIGDGINDLSLFESAGYRVAMGNAIQELKEESDLVIKSNNENGVCEYLKKLIKRM